MLPILPFDLLVPLALGTGILVLILVFIVFSRRIFLQWYSQGGQREVGQIEMLTLQAMAGERTPDAAVRWIRGGRPGRIRAFVAAADRIKATRSDWNEWLPSTEIPQALVQIAAPANGKGKGGRWQRVAAVMAIGRLELDEHDALVRALDDPDQEVAYVAAEAIARLNRPEGARAMFERIGGRSNLNDSRLATLIEAMTCDVTEVLKEALDSQNPTVLYWALTLTGRKKALELIDLVRPHLSSESPNVRASACECVGELKLKLTDNWLAPYLHDDAWFVQCHAAKALGEMGATWAAEEIAGLLYSPHWWVRQNASQALADLGSASEQYAEKVLASDDKYARNSAVEVLARVGWAEETVVRAYRSGSPDTVELLERFGRSGGLGYLENALFVVPEPSVPLLLKLLERIGDRATYGRIRASRYRLSPELQEMALATADRVKAK